MSVGTVPSLHHVFRHRRLGVLKAKHQQLAMDPRCSPPWVFLAHPSDEIAQLSIDLWPPWPVASFTQIPWPRRRMRGSSSLARDKTARSAENLARRAPAFQNEHAQA